MDAAKPGSHMHVCRVVQSSMREAPTEVKRISRADRTAAHVAILPCIPRQNLNSGSRSLSSQAFSSIGNGGYSYRRRA